MPQIEPDSVMGRPVDLGEGEKIIARFPADRGVYWRSHLVMAAALGLLAGVVLYALGNPYPVAGPVGAVLAIALRAGYLASEALGEVWQLTDRRLIGPGGRSLPLGQVREVNVMLGAVQVITRSGDKHLIKYQATPGATRAAIVAGLAGRLQGS